MSYDRFKRVRITINVQCPDLRAVGCVEQLLLEELREVGRSSKTLAGISH